MNLATLQAAMKAAVVSAAGIASTQVRWKDESAAATWIAFPTVFLSLKAPRVVGVDQVVFTYDGGADVLSPTHEGPREMVLEVRIESDSQAPGSDAFQLSSNLVTRIRRESIRAALTAVDLALSTIAPTIYAGYKSDGRTISAAITEVTLLASETDADTLSTGDYIDSVAGRSETLYGPDGSALTTEIIEVP